MANKPAAEKYLRASERRRLRNKPVRTHARHAVRDAVRAIDAAAHDGDWSPAESAVSDAVTALDRAAQKGVLHANNAARHKSRLLRRLHTARMPEAPRLPRERAPEPARVP